MSSFVTSQILYDVLYVSLVFLGSRKGVPKHPGVLTQSAADKRVVLGG